LFDGNMPRLKLSLLSRRYSIFVDINKLSDIYEDEAVITVVYDHTRATANRPICGRRCSTIRDPYTRRIRDLDQGPHQCFLVFDFDERKIRCHGGYRGVEPLDFVDRYSAVTTRFEAWVSALCAKISLTDAASVAESACRRRRS